jgi:hypothetical protein
MKPKVSFETSKAFEVALSLVEDFVFKKRNSIDDVTRFLGELEHLLSFIGNNPLTPSVDPKTGERSWIVASKEYRVYYRVLEKELGLTVYLTDIDACRAANLDRFPEHKINESDTYDTDE